MELIRAAHNGNAGDIKVLISEGADVNHVDTNGTSALIQAVANGHTECADLLVYAGANVNHAASDSYTSLIWGSC